jgi:hypothetical protein
MADALCAECHADIIEQHAHSMHRLSSFNNPASWPRGALRTSLRRLT